MTSGKLLKSLDTGTIQNSSLFVVDETGTSGTLKSVSASDLSSLLNENLEQDIIDSLGDQLSFSTGMTEWADGLTNEEINRFELQAGETLVVERLEFKQKGGGSSEDASIRVFDETGSTSIGSQELGGVSKDIGSSGEGNIVTIEISNGTGGPIIASVAFVGRIEGA